MIFSPRRLAALAVLAVAPLALFVATQPLRADSDAGGARLFLARSLSALDGGNYSAARRYARQAVGADPSWGLAHAILARTALTEGDGISAEGELDRASQVGFDMARGRQLLAHARLLQGDAAGALRIARTAGPRYWVYGLRVQAKALAAMGDPAAANAVLADAAARAPHDAATWADIGRFRLGIGDTVGAIDASARAVALDGDNLDALRLRAELVRGQYGLNAALPWFEAALKRDPYSYDVLVDYAATLGDAGRATDMLAATRRALAVRPGDARALYLLSVLAARAGSTDLARDLLQRTGGALDGMPGPLLLGATLDLDGGAHEQAVTKLRNLVAIQPMNLRARQLLGNALLRGGAARDALDVLRPLALRADADSYTLTLAARAFERTGDRVMAADMLDRAARPARGGAASFSADDSIPTLAAAASGASKGDPGTAIPLVRALIDSGDRGGALARANAVAAANPGSASAAVVLGDTLMSIGRAADAARAYRRAAGIRFDESVMLRLTEALDMAGDHSAAAATLATFLSQNPQNIAALRLAAHWQVAAGEYPAAIATLEDLRGRIGDRDAALLSELAYAYDGLGQDDVARSYAAAAYSLAPANPAAADAYGWVLYGAGDFDGALQLLEKAVAIAPGHAMLRWHLAQLYADLGRAADARGQAAAALADPRFGDRAAARKLVDRLG